MFKKNLIMTKIANKNFLNFPMIKWAKDLFPICRSITGKGTRKTLEYFRKLNPEFKNISFKSGTKVFDWQIPKEWNIIDAFIQHSSGKKFAEFKKCNLHIVSYSKPMNKKLSKKEVEKKIFVQDNQPTAVPYVTSYYKEDWGFCMSKNEKKKLPKGVYKVFIDSSLKKGNLNMSHAVLKGSSKKEIFFSSYVCHPSMANNELSGPVLLNALMLYIKKNFSRRKYSYRFVLLPETIGSIAYLSKFKNILKRRVTCGFNLTCVGDDRAYSYVSSPYENSLADESIESSLLGLKNVKKYSYLERGSDERQYCAPGVELPLIAFSRSKIYPEYHTNKDNFKLVTQKGLTNSFNVMKNIIDAFEFGIYPKANYFCEPNLGKRGLYPLTSQKGVYSKILLERNNLIAYSNGKNNIFKISKIVNKPLEKVLQDYKFLKHKKLLA